MTSTLRAPTYPSYDGRTIDLAIEPVLSVMNNADYPLLLRFDWQDLDDPSKGFTQTRQTSAVRGEEIHTNVSSPSFEAGHDYACTPILYGRDPSAAAGSVSPGRYDVLLGTGRLQDDSDITTKVYINKDITCITSPYRSSNTLMGGCALKVGNDTYLITAYNAATGEAAVASEIINGNTSALRTTSAGEAYSLISNYVTGQPFTFSVRSAPTVALSTAVVNGMLRITGTYSQAQGTPLRSYKMWVRYGLDGLFTTIEHERVYSANISEDFPISPAPGTLGTAICEITTADGYTATTNVTISSLVAENDIILEKTTGTGFLITGKPNDAKVHIWREERGSPEESSIARYEKLSYLGSTTNNAYTDNIAGCQQTYRYKAAVVETTGTVHYSDWTPQYNVYGRTCMIWQLTRLGEHKYQRVANKYITFSCDVDSGAVETVTGNAIYRSSAAKPKYIRGSDGYDTGVLTAILGTVNDPEAKPYDIRKFVEMMTSDGIFLLFPQLTLETIMRRIWYAQPEKTKK